MDYKSSGRIENRVRHLLSEQTDYCVLNTYMPVTRRHLLSSGRTWFTFSESFDGHSPSIVVPSGQISGMSRHELGRQLELLAKQARMTDILDQAQWWNDTIRLGMGNKELGVRMCMFLGWSDVNGDIAQFRVMLKSLQEMKQDREVAKAYSAICAMIDQAFKFLLTKKSRLTLNQQRAKKLILEIRQGCQSCGLLNGKHKRGCRGRLPNTRKQRKRIPR